MSKRSALIAVKEPRSRKVDTTIIVALIALIGTLGTALFNNPVILEWIRNKPAPNTSPVQAESTSNSSNQMPVASVPPLSGGDADCLTQYFADIEPTRQIKIEVEELNHDYYILSDDLAKKDFIGPLGIQLTQNARMIAALSFIFFTDSYLFKITSFVDSSCQAVTTYSNGRGGDLNTLQDSDTFTIDLAEGSFTLRFVSYGPERLRFVFQQFR